MLVNFNYDSDTYFRYEEVRQIIIESVLDWRRLFKEQIDLINQQYEPKTEVSSDSLADMLSVIIEGGIIVSRAVNEPAILGRQLLEYRNYLKLLYEK